MKPLEGFPIIPVVVIDDAEKGVPLAEALLAGGIGTVEIAFRTEAAVKACALIRKNLPEMLVGAGTIVTESQALQAIDTGCSYALAPGTDPRSIRVFQDNRIPFIPGVMTPSDIQRALHAGCTYMKFFPAERSGGIVALKAISAPYRSFGIQYCPTGGVSPANMTAYLAHEDVFAVGGTWLATRDQIASGDWTTIQQQAEHAIRMLDPAGKQAPQ